MSDKISMTKLREIIQQELVSVNEVVDHKSINGIVGVASKLLAAVEGFKEKAPPAAINAVTPHLSELEKVLENMLSSPGSYVPQPKKEPKKVSLVAAKKESIQREAADPVADLANKLARKKGFKLQVGMGHYSVQLPNGQAMSFKTKQELVNFLKGY